MASRKSEMRDGLFGLVSRRVVSTFAKTEDHIDQRRSGVVADSVLTKNLCCFAWAYLKWQTGHLCDLRC